MWRWRIWVGGQQSFSGSILRTRRDGGVFECEFRDEEPQLAPAPPPPPAPATAPVPKPEPQLVEAKAAKPAEEKPEADSPPPELDCTVISAPEFLRM